MLMQQQHQEDLTACTAGPAKTCPLQALLCIRSHQQHCVAATLCAALPLKMTAVYTAMISALTFADILHWLGLQADGMRTVHLGSPALSATALKAVLVFMYTERLDVGIEEVDPVLRVMRKCRLKHMVPCVQKERRTLRYHSKSVRKDEAGPRRFAAAALSAHAALLPMLHFCPCCTFCPCCDAVLCLLGSMRSKYALTGTPAHAALLRMLHPCPCCTSAHAALSAHAVMQCCAYLD